MPTEIARAEVQRLLATGAQLVEVLPREEYEDEHITGALSIPLASIDTEAPSRLDRNRPVVVYCFDSG
jgi:rhodanese-related sulfurtransferase